MGIIQVDYVFNLLFMDALEMDNYLARREPWAKPEVGHE